MKSKCSRWHWIGAAQSRLKVPLMVVDIEIVIQCHRRTVAWGRVRDTTNSLVVAMTIAWAGVPPDRYHNNEPKWCSWTLIELPRKVSFVPIKLSWVNCRWIILSPLNPPTASNFIAPYQNSQIPHCDGFVLRTFEPSRCWLSSRLIPHRTYKTPVLCLCTASPASCMESSGTRAFYLPRTTAPELWVACGGWRERRKRNEPFLGNVSSGFCIQFAGPVSSRYIIQFMYRICPGESPFASYSAHVLQNTPSNH